jgi:isoquinoline 1-oxidoreductase beta subunit
MNETQLTPPEGNPDATNEKKTTQWTRRSLIGTGLVLGWWLPTHKFRWVHEQAFANVEPNKDYGSPNLANAFVRIGSDDSVTFEIHKLEMGQGVFTSLAQLLAEELECRWDQIKCEHSPVAPVYNHYHAPMQFAGGSSSVPTSWEQLRRVGAMARSMLIDAAARRWKVDPKSCWADQGKVLHKTKGSFTFGELALEAQKLTPPKDIKLKTSKDFKIIGKPMPRLDAAAKGKGQATYGLDVRVPGMVYAVMAMPPFGARLKTPVNVERAKSVAGVKAVEIFDDRVAVIATTTYGAIKGREALQVEWTLGTDPLLSSEAQEEHFKKAFTRPVGPDTQVVVDHKDTEKLLEKASQRITLDFAFPFLAHAALEPLNCTVDFDGKKAKIWSAHQMPTIDRAVAAKTLDIKPEDVEVVTTFAGGSFGRRASKTSDFVVNACLVAKRLKKPVKLVYTREDDMAGGFYRPLTFHKVNLGFDGSKRLVAWNHHIVGQSVMLGSSFDAQVKKTKIDMGVVEGVQGTDYKIPAFRVLSSMPETPISTLWWRSVGHTHTAFAMEVAMDQAAQIAQKDPLVFRRELLAHSPRFLAVLDLIEKETFWKSKPAEGHAYGLAIHKSFDTVIAQVVDVSLGKDQKPPRFTGSKPRSIAVWW